MLSGAASLGAVDEQRPWVGCQLVQLDLERVCVVLDEAGQGRPVLLNGASSAHSIPPDVPTRLRRIHVFDVSSRRTARAAPEKPTGDELLIRSKIKTVQGHPHLSPDQGRNLRHIHTRPRSSGPVVSKRVSIHTRPGGCARANGETV